MDFSFSGAGFMGCYYFGVVDCLNKYIPRERLGRVAGASAGSLIAAYYLMDLPLKDCLKEIIAMTEDIRRRPLGVFDRSNQIVDILPKVLDKLFPEDAHKRVSGRLHVCMTSLKDMKKVMVSQFETKRELIDALNCSCFIPLWSGNHVSTYKGVKYIDGGFSDNLPVFDEQTIRVCCFAGNSDISPLDGFRVDAFGNFVIQNTPLYLNMANLKRARRALSPPPAAYILDLLEQGFHDTKDFILSNDLIQCNACYSSKRGPAYLSAPSGGVRTLAASPALSRAGSRRRQQANQAHQENQLLPAAASNGRSLPTDASLERHLHLKLAACKKAQEEEEEAAEINNNLPMAPCIVVEEHSDSALAEPAQVDAGEREEAERKSAQTQALSERFLRRRSTLANVLEAAGSGGELLAPARDKFKLAPVPLPSCPPSPSLDRHCGGCLRLREEARRDLLEEEIRDSAASFVDPQVLLKKSRFRVSPMRWLRHWRSRTSYDLAPHHEGDTCAPAEARPMALAGGAL